jgi:serine/threonine protein kinase
MINRLIKDYLIISELGLGGMAVVYLAEHQLLHNKVAIKVLNQEYVRNANIRSRFLAEARKMARMSHPGIVKVTDLIEDGDTVAFVMEYVDGDTLKEYLERKGKLGDEEIKTIFIQMLDAVGYVHEQNLVHRDIKPSNFMLDKKNKVKLMDFGIAKNTDASSAEYTQTGTGMQMGTPMYMSPEQITETKSVTAQSDIYSLGVVLWQMVMGKKPYEVSTLSNFQIQTKIVNEQLPLTNTKWDEIIQKATNKKITFRYSCCQELLSAIKGRGIPAFVDTETTKVEAYTVPPAHDQIQSQSASNNISIFKKSTNVEPTKVYNESQPVEINKKLTNKNSILKISLIVAAAMITVASIIIYNNSDIGEGYNTSSQEETSSSYSDEEEEASGLKTDTTFLSDNSTAGIDTVTKYKYKFYNNCPGDETVYIEGVHYNWGAEIYLEPGNHLITAKLYDNNEWVNDEVQVTLENYDENITVELFCACPFFYYKYNSELVFGGELIKNQNSISKEKLDVTYLDKKYFNSDTLRLMITEEKDEISYLDNIFLIINDNVIVPPIIDDSNKNTLLINEDKKYLIMNKGDDFELMFVLPDIDNFKSAKICSKGYYRPLPIK